MANPIIASSLPQSKIVSKELLEEITETDSPRKADNEPVTNRNEETGQKKNCRKLPDAVALTRPDSISLFSPIKASTDQLAEETNTCANTKKPSNHDSTVKLFF